MRTYEQSHEFPTDNMKKPVPEDLIDDIALYREVAAQAEAVPGAMKDTHTASIEARMLERRKEVLPNL
jgi:hypothetical protein